MKPYDFIFAGGGLAGLSLACRLSNSPLRERSMLIVDREAKQRNDRTWCFWTEHSTPFDSIVHREWDRIHFSGDRFERDIELGRYRYKMIRGLDLYSFAQRELAARGNVEFLRGTVEAIQDGPDAAQVSVDGQTYAGRWVFDSRPARDDRAGGSQLSTNGRHSLQQIFKGWEIETTRAAFDIQVPTLMDLRTPQKGAMRFFYLLPLSERRALVEYVTLEKDNCDAALKAYIEGVLGIRDYRVVYVEGGVNPMTDRRFPRRAGRRIMNIGARGGRVKPSSGYAFLRIQQDSAAIVQSLIRTASPFNVPQDSRRYVYYDSLMLEVMQRHGDQIKSIFTELFKNNPIERVLRFLDEKGSPEENVQLIATLPPRLFLQAMVSMRSSGTIRLPKIARA